MISCARRSRVLRKSSPARSSGTRIRAVARNMASPENGAPSRLLLNSSMLTPRRVKAWVTSRTMPGRSWPTTSSLNVLSFSSRLGVRAAARPHSKAGRLEIAQGGGEDGDIRIGNADEQDPREFARQTRRSALQPRAAASRHFLRNRVHQTGSVVADESQYDRRRHARLRCDCKPVRFRDAVRALQAAPARFDTNSAFTKPKVPRRVWARRFREFRVALYASVRARPDRIQAGEASLETALYLPVKRHLESLGYSVKGEIGGCDLVGLAEGESPVVVIGEMKLTFTFELALQGVDRLAAGDEVWLAARLSRNGKGRENDPRFRNLCRRLGFGLLGVGPSGEVHVLLSPCAPAPRRDPKRRSRLVEEHRRRRGDPTAGGGSREPIMTAYRQQALICAAARPAARRDRAISRSVRPTRRRFCSRNVYGWFDRGRAEVSTP